MIYYHTVANVSDTMGDWVHYTPLLRAKPGMLVVARDTEKNRRYSALYDGLADVAFIDSQLRDVSEGRDPVVRSQRLLNRYGLVDHSPIPFVRVTTEEKEWARDFLKDYPNPIVFHPLTGSANLKAPASDPCNYRCLLPALVECVVNVLKDAGHTILKFGTDDERTRMDIPNVINLPGLTIRKLIACYCVIGHYVGTDSGDAHLMLGCGGDAMMLIPPEGATYRHDKCVYGDYAWKHEPVCRVTYSIFKHCMKVKKISMPPLESNEEFVRWLYQRVISIEPTTQDVERYLDFLKGGFSRKQVFDLCTTYMEDVGTDDRQRAYFQANTKPALNDYLANIIYPRNV